MFNQTDLGGYTASFVDGLYQAGVHKVVISPGSRSTPLAITFHAHPQIETWINVDERSAAFFALGMAKALHEPVVLLCSSGTAAANYFPAIIEARYSRVPLIVLTADRPHELREVGAPQTIDQIKLYGNHVKHYQDMPIPDGSPGLNHFVKASAIRACGAAIDAPSGPVHLNFPFREPLVPEMKPELFHTESPAFTQSLTLGSPAVDEVVYTEWALLWKNVERPLICVGPQTNSNLRPYILELANLLNAPVIADPLSGLRIGGDEASLIISGYDAFLRSDRFTTSVQPDAVIRFGAMPVSKPFLKYLEKCNPKHYWVVDEAAVFREPTHLATQFVKSDAALFCKSLTTALERVGYRPTPDWLSLWQRIDKVTASEIHHFVEDSPWFEGQVVDHVLKQLDDHAALFVGNSMPIRDVDTFLLERKTPLALYANRGANGIDGVVSTALGVSAVRKPVTLLIGDLSFFHDMNGLMVAKRYGLDITIVVINNNGGGIFSFLSQAKEKEETFETLFGTPLDIDIEAVARLYGANFSKAVDLPSFTKAVEEGKAVQGLKIIEAVTERKENAALHRDLWSRVVQAVDQALERSLI